MPNRLSPPLSRYAHAAIVGLATRSVHEVASTYLELSLQGNRVHYSENPDY